MKILTKFLQEFNRELTDSERLKLLKKYYNSQPMLFDIGSGNSKIIISTYPITKNMHTKMYTLNIEFDGNMWKKMISKYEEPVKALCTTKNNITRFVKKKCKCIMLTDSEFGLSIGLTNFEKTPLFLKKLDYIILRFDPITWEHTKCKVTKELNYI